MPLTDGVQARLTLSINPESGEVDGPYVLIGATEYTVAQAAALVASLAALVTTDEPAD